MVKNLPVQKMKAHFLGGEDLLWGSPGNLFNSWVGRKAWQPTPVFLPAESPWTEDPVSKVFP